MKAVAVAGEAEGFVEAVGGLAGLIAGEHELVAARAAAFGAGVVHERAADALALMLGVDGDIFDDAGWASALGEVVHDEQGIGGDSDAGDLGDEEAVRRVGLESGVVGAGFLGGKGRAVVKPGDGVEAEDGFDVGGLRFADGHGGAWEIA